MEGSITQEINRAKLLGVEVYEASETFKGHLLYTTKGFRLAEGGLLTEKPQMFLDDLARRFHGKKARVQIRVVVELE